MGHPEHTTRSHRANAAATRVRRAVAAALLLVVAAAVTCVLAAAAAAPPAAAAPSLFDLQKEAKRTRTEMAQLQTELQQAGNDLFRAQAQLDQVTQRLQTARSNLSRAQQDLDLQREVLARRAALLYKTGGFDWLDIISNLRSLTDIDTVRSLEQDLAEQDRVDRTARSSSTRPWPSARRSSRTSPGASRRSSPAAAWPPRCAWPGTASSRSSRGPRPCSSPCASR